MFTPFMGCAQIDHTLYGLVRPPGGGPAGGFVWQEPAKRGNDLSPPSFGLPLCVLCVRLHPGENRSGLYPSTKAARATGTVLFPQA